MGKSLKEGPATDDTRSMQDLLSTLLSAIATAEDPRVADAVARVLAHALAPVPAKRPLGLGDGLGELKRSAGAPDPITSPKGVAAVAATYRARVRAARAPREHSPMPLPRPRREGQRWIPSPVLRRPTFTAFGGV